MCAHVSHTRMHNPGSRFADWARFLHLFLGMHGATLLHLEVLLRLGISADLLGSPKVSYYRLIHRRRVHKSDSTKCTRKYVKSLH